jgi:hypothetical protein
MGIEEQAYPHTSCVGIERKISIGEQ